MFDEIDEFIKKFDLNLSPSGQTNFEPIFKKIISLDKSIKWISHRKEFTGYMKYKRKRIFCALYGPEDIELGITAGYNGSDYRFYDGPEVSELYKKLSSR